MTDTKNVQIVIEAQAKVDAATKEVASKLDGLKGKVEGMSPIFKKMAIAGTAVFGAISGIAITSINAAKEAEVEMAKFNTTLDTMGKKGKEAKGRLLEMANAATKLAFDDEDAANSLAKLYQRTGDVTKAQKLFGVVMDLSRAKSIDLSTATVLVNQVLSGNGRILKQYGIDLKESATPLEALGELQMKVKGQAEAFANTYEGRMQVLNVQFQNMKESVGDALIPILTKLLEKITPVVEKVLEWVQKNPELTQKIIVWGAALSGAVVALSAIGLALPAIITSMQMMGTTAVWLATTPLGQWLLILGEVATAIILINDSIKKFQELTGQIQGDIQRNQSAIDHVNSVIDKTNDPAKRQRLIDANAQAISANEDLKRYENSSFLGKVFFRPRYTGQTASSSENTYLTADEANTRASVYNITFNGDITDKNEFVRNLKNQMSQVLQVKTVMP